MSRQNRLEWFGALKRAQAPAVRAGHDLIVELEIDRDMRNRLQQATMTYIGEGLGMTGNLGSPESFMNVVDARFTELYHRTPNGVVLPKREFEESFNALQGLFGSYVRSLRIEHLLSDGFAPLTVRLARGTSDPSADKRPFASTKTHVDLWSGDPADTVTLFVPIMGDIEQSTVDFFHPPDDLESTLLKPLSGYDEGMRLLGDLPRYDLRMKHGYAYVMDAVVPHRTVNMGGGPRVTLQVQFRRATTAAERASIEAVCDAGRLSHFISRDEWFSLGTTKRMQFIDTFADAKRGVFTSRPYNERIYSLADVERAV